MKKTLTILCTLALAISCFALIGCGGNDSAEVPADSPYIGTWQAASAEFSGETADIKEVLDSDFIIELNGDGSAHMSYDGEEATGTWSETKNGVKVVGGDYDMELKDDGGKLTIEMFGFHMYFEKQA